MRTETRKNLSPFLIPVFIAGFIAFLAWSGYRSAGLGSRVTDPDYYSKGLKYNTSRIEKKAAETLGWRLATRLEGRMLDFHLTDGSGNDVDRATGFRLVRRICG